MSGTSRLPRAAPECQGISGAALNELIGALDDYGDVHSLMVVKGGAVVAETWWEPYSADRPHSMNSVSKSFTAIAIGMAIDEGLLNLDDPVEKLLPGSVPIECGPQLHDLRVRHLLTMTTGHSTDTVDLARLDDRRDWAESILSAHFAHSPGTTFVYNSGATYLLSAIISAVTGTRLLDYLVPRLLEPLGIARATWVQSPTGIDAGGWGLSITTEDLAVFGEFCRLKGAWKDRQLVSSTWIDEATRPHISTAGPGVSPDWSQGYGYQFWVTRYDSYQANGAFGQVALIVPGHDLVVAVTAGSRDQARILDAVWAYLLPGLSPLPQVATSGSPSIQRRELPVIEGFQRSDQTLRAVFERSHIEPIRRFGLDGSPYSIRGLRGSWTIDLGHGRWRQGILQIGGRHVPIAACAAWMSHHRWNARIALIDTPYCFELDLDIHGKTVEIGLEMNVSFGPTSLGAIKGRLLGDAPSVVQRSPALHGDPPDYSQLQVELDDTGGISLELT